MTSPRGIHSTTSHAIDQEDDSLTYGESYQSTHTDLSLNSRDIIMAEQWIILGKIGEGSFGEVFEVRDINTHRHFAVKRETMKIKHPQLHYENVMYNVLAGGVGIPQCHWYGQFDGFDCIVMDLLGPNLGQVRQNISCMEMDIAVELASQMVSIVEQIHDRGVIVRDIKPDNFLFPANCQLPETEMIESIDEFGMPMTAYKKSTCKQVFTEQWGIEKPKIYAVDFGLACYWRDPETGKTHPDTKKHIRSKTGTARYASINVHKGRSHSRRDDVESIGYVLLDLLLGTLPWTGIHAKNSKAGWDRMRQLKIDTFMSDLCAGLPRGVLEFVEYPRTLQFGDQPDYEKMRRFLEGCLPGGAYSDIVKSPFGGESKSTDNYDVIQLELKQMQQKLLEEQRLYQLNHGRSIDDDDHNALFTMDDMTHHLPTSVVPESKLSPPPESQQRKHSTTSQSSLKKLLKQNRANKVGWNTWKHDEAPWNPKTDWTNDEDSGANMAKSWGDDQQGIGTWDVTLDAQQDETDSWNKNPDDLETNWNEKPSWDPTPSTQPTPRDSWKTTCDVTESNWNNSPQQTQTDSWKKKDNIKETKWNEPSWDTTPSTKPAYNDSWKKTSGITGSNWGNPSQQKQTDSWKKKDDINETKWNEPWNTTPAPQRTQKDSRKPHDDNMEIPQRNDRRGRFKSESTNEWQHQGTNIHDTTSWRTEPKIAATPETFEQKGRSWQSYPSNETPINQRQKPQQQQQQQQQPRRRHFSQPHQRYPTNTNSRHRTPQQQRQHGFGQRSSEQPENYIKTPEDTQVDGWQRKPGSNSWQQKG